MVKIESDNIVLRDMIESDIEDYVRWFTNELEWENWDAPWEKEDTSEEIERKRWTEYYESVKNRPDDALRWKFEIEWNGRHIGWVSSYYIDENYEWVEKNEDGQIVYRAIGIDICESDLYGNGIGTNALRVLINFYFENGENELYLQTWSGNVRMIRCAEKLGFAECERDVGELEYNGKKYDGLTFRKGRQERHDLYGDRKSGMRLRSFKTEDAPVIASWLRTEEELYLWSADRYNKFPIFGEDILDDYAPRVGTGRFFPLTAVDDGGESVGHIIIRYPRENDDSSVRFGFIILKPELRGQGLGKEMLRLGIEYVKDYLTASRISLGVFEDNKSAKYCYEASGFKEYSRRECELPVGTMTCIDLEMYVDR